MVYKIGYLTKNIKLKLMQKKRGSEDITDLQKC